MKMIVLVFCSLLLSTALANPTHLEEVLNDLEVVLQDLKQEEQPVEDIPRANQVPDDFIMNELHAEQPLPAEFMGDIPFAVNQKQLPEEILLHTNNIEATTAEIEAIGGRVTIQLCKDLLIAKVPSDIATQQSLSTASTHISNSATPETLSNVRAYWQYRDDKLNPQPKAQQWTDKTPPKAIEREDIGHSETNSPYSLTMTGKIAVTVLAVSGPGNLEISSSEYDLIKSQVISGLKFWADNAPSSADLSFVVCFGKPQINVADNLSCGGFQSCHDPFANAALKVYNYEPGSAGKDRLAQKTKEKFQANGAFISFFSKYNQRHFAYAYSGGGPIYMEYSNDGWGPNQIYRVFAHEVGHVFNAADEYGNCKCQVNGKGSCTTKNNNCKNCVSSQSNCIMGATLMSLCEYTKKHVGWC